VSETNNLIYGTRAIIEAILAGKEVDKVFVQKNLKNELIRELLENCRNHNIPVAQVPVEKLNRLTRKNHQGAVSFLSSVEFSSLDNIVSEAYRKGENPFILILDRITDVRNFGAIARTAEGAGVHAMVVPTRGNAPTNPDAVKTSAGALHHIPVCREENLKNAISFLKESGISVIACTEKSEKLIYEIDLTTPVAILLGSEEDGISPEYLKMCDYQAKIPMFGKIGSLNVSVSGGLIMFEVVRQRLAK
jgi:23S rRNA (guanosine2251-2'-O)-methyltransferase